jgi:hypothetical protein
MAFSHYFITVSSALRIALRPIEITKLTIVKDQRVGGSKSGTGQFPSFLSGSICEGYHGCTDIFYAIHIGFADNMLFSCSGTIENAVVQCDPPNGLIVHFLNPAVGWIRAISLAGKENQKTKENELA